MCYPPDRHTHEGSDLCFMYTDDGTGTEVNSLPMVTNAKNEKRDDFRTETLKHLHDVSDLSCDHPSCWALIIRSACAKGNVSVAGVKKLT